MTCFLRWCWNRRETLKFSIICLDTTEEALCYVLYTLFNYHVWGIIMLRVYDSLRSLAFLFAFGTFDILELELHPNASAIAGDLRPPPHVSHYILRGLSCLKNSEHILSENSEADRRAVQNRHFPSSDSRLASEIRRKTWRWKSGSHTEWRRPSFRANEYLRWNI